MTKGTQKRRQSSWLPVLPLLLLLLPTCRSFFAARNRTRRMHMAAVQAGKERSALEEEKVVSQLRSLIISMEGWRGQEQREEVDQVVEAWRQLLEGVSAPARLVQKAEEER